jgi:mycothiol synthase
MIRTRSYGSDDYARVMAFLRRLYMLDPDQPYWLPARWEYATYLVAPLYCYRGYPDWTQTIRIWEDDGDGIVAIVNSENPDKQAFLHVHPSYRNLESELLRWAEENIATPAEGSDAKEILVWAINGDTTREGLLTDRGYVRQDTSDYLLWQELDQKLPNLPIPEGYSVHTMLEEGDLDEKIACMTGAFRSGPYPREIYETMQSAPSYRPEFDLFTRDAGSTVTSFCIIWVDAELKTGYFEPVGTHPEHQRRGLGGATLSEGLRRLKHIGIRRAYVGAGGDWRKAFYTSAGFTGAILFRPWQKHL